MLFWIIPLCFGIVSLIVFLIFRVLEKRKIAVILKGITSLLFITTALVAWLSSNNPNNLFGVFILIALSFGLLGDVFLDIKFISEKYNDLFTILGFLAFGLGHISFITGLFLKFYDFSANPLYLIIPILFAIIGVGISLLLERLTAIRYKKMKPCAIIYGFILFFATAIYLSAAIQSGWQILTINMMAIGLILFMLSDLILNNTYFAPNCNTPIFIISNHVIYYLAQFTIAISLFFLI